MPEQHIINLSPMAIDYLRTVGLEVTVETAATLWFHVQAVAFASSYSRENADDLVMRPPRIPLASNLQTLEASSMLGRRVFSLLDTDVPVLGVSHNPDVTYALLGNLGRLDPGDMRPIRPRDLNISVGWGRMGGNGVTPGRGRLLAHSEDTPALEGADVDDDAELDEEVVYDIFLNDALVWHNVPAAVWQYRIAGYRVLKKWLSYREASVIGRPISIGEAQHFTGMVRRIAAIIAMEPDLNANYEALKADFYVPGHVNG